GPYTETHAHQDQGAILMFKDGVLAEDPVVDSHSGLPQETTAHNLVRVDSNGAPVKQIVGTTSHFAAMHHGNGWIHATADVTAAYNGNAAIQLVQRELVYLQPDVLIVYDRVKSAPGTTQTWQLVIPTAPSISGATANVNNGAHTMH